MYKFSLVLLLFLAGCNTTKQMVIPISSEKPTFSKIKMKESKTNFALAKIINDIDRGDPIFAFPAKSTTKGSMCNYMYQGDTTITYGGGKQYLGDWSSELGEVFYETLTSMGYNVAGDPSDLFNQNNVANSAEYLIGGRIMKMSGNFCHAHHWWDGRPLYTYSGELYVQIEWSVLNTLTKDIVLKKKTSGYFKQDNPIKNGIAVSFDNAFANAAEKFASINSMRKLATGEQIKTAGNSSNLDTVSIMQGQETKNFNLENVQSKVVTIRIGRGHGIWVFCW